MPRSEFGRFLARSFEALEREHPEAHARFCRALAGRAIRLEVDPPAALARFADGGVRVGDATVAEADLRLGTDKATVLDLIDGRYGLLDAVRSDRMRLRGTLRSVAEFHDALMEYLDGAVRCPSFPELLDGYRRSP